MTRKLLSIDTSENVRVLLFGRKLLQYSDNLIMSFRTDRWQEIPSPKFGADALRFERITPQNIGEGFFMYDKAASVPVSRLWVMYRSSRQCDMNGLYRIITPKAWIFNANTLGRYRSQGIYTYLLRSVFKYLHEEKGIDSVSLSVARNNKPAIHAYKKCGAVVQSRKVSVSLLRLVFPRHSI